MADELGTAVLKVVVEDTEALRKLDALKQKLGNIDSATGRSTRSRATPNANTEEAARKRAERVAEQAANKRVSIQSRLNLLEAKGVNVTAFRLRAAQANAAAQQSEFDSAHRINAQLSRALSLEENRLRVSAAQAAQLKRQEAAAKGTASTATKASQKPTGVGFATTPEQILSGRGGIQKGAATGFNTLETSLNKAVQLRNRLNVLDAKGVDISSLRATYEKASAAAGQGQFGTSQRLLQNLTRQISLQENDLRIIKLKEAAEKRRIKAATQAATGNAKPQGPVSPVGGLRSIPDSPAGIRAQQRLDAKIEREARAAERRAKEAERAAGGVKANNRLGGAVGSALIGGGFPLLFGQGVGASLGGAAGGAIGGAIGGQFGFGLSIVGTILGAQVDAITQRFTALGSALQDPIANFDVFIEKAVLASKSQEALAKALQESGQNAAASELLRKEATRTLDPIAAEGAASAQDNYNRALSDMQDVLGNIVSGPASGFLSFLARVLRTISDTPGDTPGDAGSRLAQSQRNALRNSAGGIGAGVLGFGLIGAGAAALATGVGAPIGAGLIASGVATAGIGGAGLSSSAGDFRASSSKEVLQLEKQLEATKVRQAAIERQILQARAAGKDGLVEQLSLQAQFAALKAEEIAGLSRIQQELARDRDKGKALRQEEELRKAIELRRQALLAAASAGQTAAIRDLATAKQLVGVYGSQRDILIEQQKIRQARTNADDAQKGLNTARANGADPKEIEAAEKRVNEFINRRIAAEITGQERISRIKAEEATRSQLDATNNSLALQSVKERIAAATKLGSVEQGVTRSTLEQADNIRAGIDAAKRREQAIGAQITAARQLGDEVSANDLVGQQKTAAEETKLLMIEGANALRDAGAQLVKDAEGAFLSLQKLRTGDGGLNQYLSPQDRVNQEEKTFKALMPGFREAQEQFKKLRGVNYAPEFSGSTASVNQGMIKFIEEVKTELGAVKSVADTSTALNANSAELGKLTTEIAELTKKNWNVQVNVEKKVLSPDAQAEINRASTLP